MSSSSTVPTSLWRRLRNGPLQVLIIGGGNWGTVISRIAARNVKSSYIFADTVYMWLHEEDFNGRKLTEVINERHENPKYLPRHLLPDNLIATSELVEVAKLADLIVVVIPHQFVSRVCMQMKGHVKKSARAISLVKGLDIDNGNPKLFSTVVSEILGIGCSVLSGANVANDIAREEFCESTLGYTEAEKETAAVWCQLLDTPHFKINGIPDIAGVEVCGAVKNVIALAAGFCDGLGYGTNTKAAIIRVGVEEMRRFANYFFDGVLEDTFFDSAGYADVITTCFGGRNVRCAAEFIRRGSKTDWATIEADLLGGQKMQGQLTCEEVYKMIEHHKLQDMFPLFTVVYQIAFEKAPPSAMIDRFAREEARRMKPLAECSPCPLPPSIERTTNQSPARRR